MTSPIGTSLSLHDFETASQTVLAFLQQRHPLGLWMVTRTEHDDWIVLQTEDHGYGVKPGTVFRWADSFCSEMVKGHGPRVAPDSDAVPAYARAPIRAQVPIKAYVGVPLLDANGGVFGTLCGIDRTVQPDTLVNDQPLFELLASLLSALLRAELKAEHETRRNERLEMEAQTDALTQLYNRRAWDRLLAMEEERCRRYGYSAAVLCMDLDELKRVNDSQGHAAGDALIRRAAQALRQAAREVDVVARLGGDEFGLIGVECDAQGAQALLERIRKALATQGVAASIGMAQRAPAQGLAAAWQVADERMYADKRTHQTPGPVQ
jgi:diguanylate cyclase